MPSKVMFLANRTTPELLGNGEKIRRVFMELSQECEGVIVVPPLQSKEGFFCSDPSSIGIP